MEIANNPDMYIRFLRSRLLGGIRSFHPTGLQSHSSQLLSSETLALNGEHCSIIKDPVQSTQQGIVLIEVASPVRGMLVAGKYNIEVEELDPYALRELVKAIYVDAPVKINGKRTQHIHIQYDGIGFIPLDELLKEKTA